MNVKNVRKENDRMFQLNNKVYKILKWVTMIVLPAIATLYFALSQIWGFPYGSEIVATITATATFIGALIGVSTKSYNQSGADAELHGGENDALLEEEHELVEPDDALVNEDLGW